MPFTPLPSLTIPKDSQVFRELHKLKDSKEWEKKATEHSLETFLTQQYLKTRKMLPSLPSPVATRVGAAYWAIGKLYQKFQPRLSPPKNTPYSSAAVGSRGRSKPHVLRLKYKARARRHVSIRNKK